MVYKSIVFLLILICFSLRGQELPPINNYAPITYTAGNQNWALSQSRDKFVYVANNDGLLEFNGSQWKLYPSPNGTPLKSVMVIGERIYTGCYMEFGFWQKDELGNLNYESVSAKLNTPLVEDEHFWGIAEYKNWVLFQSLDRIYIYNITSETFNMLDARTTRASILEVDDKIYFQKIGEGIFTIDNGKAVLVSNDDILKNDIVVGAFLYKGEILLVTEQSGIFVLTKDKLLKWSIADDTFLSKIKVYSTLELVDGSIVLGTISNGVYIIDKKGQVQSHLNQEKGINNNTVLSLFQDHDLNLWLGLDNGISVVNLNSPFSEYIDYIGELGVVYTAILYKDFLYLGTNQGLFVKNRNDPQRFQLIEGTQGQVWLLKEVKGKLFCGHHTGTFTVEGNKVEKISDYPGTWDIHNVANDNNLLLQGNYEGLSVLEKVNDKWIFRNKIKGFDNSSRFFEFVNDHHVLVNHDYKGIFDLKLNTDFTAVDSVRQLDSKGTGSSLLTYNSDIVYTTDNGVFKYDRSIREFVFDAVLSNKFFNKDDNVVGILRSTENGHKLWGFSNDHIINVSPGLLSGEPERIKVPIPKFFRRSMGVLGFESIVHLKDQLYLIGISNGYVTLDLNKVEPRKFQLSINSISREIYGSPKLKVNKNELSKFDFAENSLSFQFTVPEFDKYTDVYYQYRLEGLYDEWSIWSTRSDASFKNLPFGSYVFQVRAKVGNEAFSNMAVYNFIVKRPWYLSIWAIVGYFLLGAMLLALIHKLYKRYYNKQQAQLLKESKKRLKRKKLKNQKKIVQIKNEQLQELVESKNRELAISTMSIIKKNEFLNAIKDQLKDASENTKIKSVIRTIDRNINNEDDWKFFENAFNNADKDFLKKIKTTHPELSSNDLRLCAYLRLNLSSKEIAPLLNISVRSVEVKRYRLRKKMNLTHDIGLTEYIIQL